MLLRISRKIYYKENEEGYTIVYPFFCLLKIPILHNINYRQMEELYQYPYSSCNNLTIKGLECISDSDNTDAWLIR